MSKRIVHPLLSRDVLQCACWDCREMRSLGITSSALQGMHNLQAAVRQLKWAIIGPFVRWR